MKLTDSHELNNGRTSDNVRPKSKVVRPNEMSDQIMPLSATN